MKFKRLLSYFYPIKEYQISSSINENIEVTWNNGQLVLDSKNMNFSYGSLERVMQIGLQNIGKQKINTLKNTLVLGVAGGSVIKVLQKEFDYKGTITGIELDSEIIKVANDYFKLKDFPNLNLIENDANEFVEQTNEIYDFIVVDIFQDKIMPDFLFSEDFIGNLNRILSEKGIILFNTIVTLSHEFERNLKFEKALRIYFSEIKKITQVEGNNELFLISK
ncbi:spermidine synthase [Flavobacterium sp. H122]|uniref:spermidine synthase n=1 Tax=Flavobacterium sp. H122 TaxID=2529860 RepID=UPI0010AA8AD7|nr:fused MFS/spermidine synthase [Flavobacterium sp. H122]